MSAGISEDPMGESQPRHTRLRAFLRGFVAWSYLATGLLVVPMMADLMLHELGLISESLLPVPPELGGWVLGVLIFLGWPFAVAIAWFLRQDRVLAVPAVLFLAAELIFAILYWISPTSTLLFSLSGMAGAVYGVSAIRAWVLWIRDPG